jgi:eukaryotic-like serine/threonine-protein kinase
VPNVVGRTLAQAKSVIFTAGFHKYHWLYGCYGSPNIGDVVKQIPGAEAQAPGTTRVQLYLQAENCLATVPNVVGRTLAQAKSVIFTAGFHKYSWQYGCYGSPNIGDVVKQIPGAEAQAPRTTRVQFYLQANNCPTTVPNVIGMNESNAISTIEQAGFRVHWIFLCLGSPNIGLVVTQSPAAGASYDGGNTVTIKLQANNCS